MHLSEQLGRSSLVEARLAAREPDRLEQPTDPGTSDVARVLGHLEAHEDVRLRRKVVDLVWLRDGDRRMQRRGVPEISVVQMQPAQDVIDAAGIELLARRTRPCTSYPLPSRSSAKYDPS